MSVCNPKVSVVIPTFNRANTIVRAVTSVLNQTYEDFELIIIDDGSKDNTKEVIAQIQDTRVRYIKSPINRGAANARNSGIRAAKGEYIAFQDSDDEWLPDKLKLQVEAMDGSAPEVGLVYTRFYYEREEGRLEWPPISVPMQQKSGHIFAHLLNYNPVGGPTMLVRKECFQTVGLFDTELRSMEDYELALRIAKRYQLLLIDELLVKAHVTSGSLSENVMAHVQTSCLILKLYKEDIIRYNLLERKLEELRTLAGRILTSEQVEQMIEATLRN